MCDGINEKDDDTRKGFTVALALDYFDFARPVCVDLSVGQARLWAVSDGGCVRARRRCKDQAGGRAQLRPRSRLDLSTKAAPLLLSALVQPSAALFLPFDAPLD